MKANTPKKIQHVENVLPMISTMTEAGKKSVIEVCIKVCLMSSWRLRKNRTHIQEIIKKMDKICKNMNVATYFSYLVPGFTFDWSAYDYRKC